MSVTATTAVWEHSAAAGNARLVLLALADHVNEQRLQAGHPWEAWPSQSTLARMCNCSRSSVKRALEELRELGEIEDTGERRLRGSVVYEILVPDLADYGPDQGDDLAQSGPGGGDDTAQDGPSGASENIDLAHSAHDLAHSGPDLAHLAGDLAHFGPPPGSVLVYKPEENQKLEPEERTRSEHRSTSPAAKIDRADPSNNGGAEGNDPDSSDLAADPPPAQATQTKQPLAVREAEEREEREQRQRERDEGWR